MTRYKEAYGAEIAAFVEAIQTGSTPPTTGLDGLAALALADAAVLSVKAQRAVKVSEILGS